MDAQIDRHQPLITARLVFAPKALPPPPIISARKEFPPISVTQQYERSPTPEVRTSRKYSSTPNSDVDLGTTSRSRRPTPINTRAVAFKDVDMGSPLTPTPAELDSEEDGEASTKIPKPPGTVGRPQSGGYNLEEKLGWNDTTYKSILVSLLNASRSILNKLQNLVHKLAKARLDTVKSFRGQDMKKIKQICDAVSFSGRLSLM
jgi:hypothetical protein